MTVSLVALQYLTAKMLRGQTLVGNVYAAPTDPAAEENQSVAKGLLAVVIGDDKRKPVGQALNDGERNAELILQAFLPESIRIEFDGVPIVIEGRGAGGELAMSILMRQVERQMQAGRSPEAMLWRRLVTRIHEVASSSYLFEVKKGVRLAARETVYTLETVDEPGFGDDELTELWAEICDVLDADPDYAPIGAWIRSELTAGETLPRHIAAAADQGLTDDAVAAIGLAPALGHAEDGDDAAVLDAITLDPLGLTEEAEEPAP